MKLNLKAALETLRRSLEGQKTNVENPPPVSMVLLLHEPRFFTLEELRLAANVAYGVSFSGERSAQYCVFQEALFTLIKVGPHTLSFLYYTKPFGESPEEFGKALPTTAQRVAWAKHTSWTAVDYVRGEAYIEAKYAVLGRLCEAMLNDNCVGIYIPSERSLVPNDGSLVPTLRRISSSRDIDLLSGGPKPDVLQ